LQPLVMPLSTLEDILQGNASNDRKG
jgi:hypothetical protein